MNLLQPRYKVIADYPGSKFKIGQIITLDKFSNGKYWHEYTEKEPVHFEEDNVRYPAIFQKLEWWMDREISEMPKYISCDHSVFDADSKYGIEVIKCYGWDMPREQAIISKDGKTVCSIHKGIFPATEEEYNKHKTI